MDSFLNKILSLYPELINSTIRLSYLGDLNEPLVSAIFKLAERDLMNHNVELKNRKRICNVIIECLQNISKHGINNTSQNPSFFITGLKNNKYLVCSGNVVHHSSISELKSKIDHLNSLDDDEILEMYKSELLNNNISDKGGAGLGLIDMKKRSRNNMEHTFIKIDNELSYFILCIPINLNN